MRFSPCLALACATALAVLGLRAPTLARAQTWQTNSAPPAHWSATASSASGRRLLAVSHAIYSSKNAGATWTTLGPSGAWHAVAMSANGKVQAVARGWYLSGPICVSTNSGQTWVVADTPSNDWRGIAISAAGHTLVAVGEGPLPKAALNPGPIYTSVDAGVSWSQAGAPLTNWAAVALSADGTKAVACAGASYQTANYFGPIYRSTDSGTAWKPVPGTARGWCALTSSADGEKLAAAERYGYIYTSTNSGLTWTASSAPWASWWSIASSADGMKLVACVPMGPIYTSTDAGATWLSNAVPTGEWMGVASSADGNALIAVMDAAYIYTLNPAQNPTPPLSITLSPSRAVVSWPFSAADFDLYETATLPAMNWTPVHARTIIDSTGCWVSLPSTPSPLFYRLQSP